MHLQIQELSPISLPYCATNDPDAGVERVRGCIYGVGCNAVNKVTSAPGWHDRLHCNVHCPRESAQGLLSTPEQQVCQCASRHRGTCTARWRNLISMLLCCVSEQRVPYECSRSHFCSQLRRSVLMPFSTLTLRLLPFCGPCLSAQRCQLCCRRLPCPSDPGRTALPLRTADHA